MPGSKVMDLRWCSREEGRKWRFHELGQEAGAKGECMFVHLYEDKTRSLLGDEKKGFPIMSLPLMLR